MIFTPSSLALSLNHPSLSLLMMIPITKLDPQLPHYPNGLVLELHSPVLKGGSHKGVRTGAKDSSPRERARRNHHLTPSTPLQGNIFRASTRGQRGTSEIEA